MRLIVDGQGGELRRVCGSYSDEFRTYGCHCFIVISAFQRVSGIPFSFVQLPSWSHRVPSRVSATPLVWR